MAATTPRPPSYPLSPPQSPRPASADLPRPSFRRARSARRASFSHAPPLPQRLLHSALQLARQALHAFEQLPGWQRGLLIAAGATSLLFGVLFLVYNERIFAWLVPVAARWRALPGGWLILWALTVTTAFPPMIGYSTCVTVAGFLYGFPAGWPVAAAGNVAGSLLALLLFRTACADFAARTAAADARFAAFARVLERDGFRILAMIRLCPLPYSLSNAALATFPAVRPLPFAAATALATPKLLIHVFVGSRLAALAESGDKGLDFGAKLANWLGIGLGVAIGAVTGWYIYQRTAARARELEAEEWDKVDERDGALRDPDEFEDEADEEAGLGAGLRPAGTERADVDEIDFPASAEANEYHDEPRSPEAYRESQEWGIGLERQPGWK